MIIDAKDEEWETMGLLIKEIKHYGKGQYI